MKKSRFILYKITCTPTGMIYIGLTTQSLAVRWSGHLWASGKFNTKLGRTIKKYGRDAFLIEHIASSRSWEDLLLAEKALIAQYDSKRSGLNSTDGGDGILGAKFNEASKLKMSAIRTASWRSEEYRAKISASQKTAWARKSEKEIDQWRVRASENQSLRIWKANNPRSRKPKPVRWKGKGWNMKIKTHCPHGHPYSAENTFIRKCDGGRECLVCKRAKRNVSRDRKSRERKMASLAAEV